MTVMNETQSNHVESGPEPLRKHPKSKTRHYFDSASFALTGETAPVNPKLFAAPSSLSQPPTATVEEGKQPNEPVLRKTPKKCRTRCYFDSASYAMTGEVANVHPKLFDAQSGN